MMVTMSRKIRLLARTVTVIQIVCQVYFPALSYAAGTIPGFYGTVKTNIQPPAPTTLPELKTIVRGAAMPTPMNNELTIHQTEDKAILEWKSFDIGEDATVRFDQQKNGNWSTLNRIFDKNPTQIYGKLLSDGRIYLINANGILFSPSSQVNVHSITASSLGLPDGEFLAGLPSSDTDDIMLFSGDDAGGAVSNHGLIQTDSLGSVFLMGPVVENAGTIESSSGQVVLAAGSMVGLRYNPEGSVSVFVKEAGMNGVATNFEQGRILVDPGMVGMYGRIVNQDGLIRSVSALKKDGRVELMASEAITTGQNSSTLCQVSDSKETVHSSFPYDSGEVTIGTYSETSRSEVIDRYTVPRIVDHRGVISAQSGTVSVSASERLFLGEGSIIDVSGVYIDKPAEDARITAQLNSVQLRDDYGQKDGIIKGESIETSALNGSAIGDLSGHLNKEELTARDRSTDGGMITLVSGGDIIAVQGTLCDFSGGGIHYLPGAYATTKLVSGQTACDISSANQWTTYDKILGSWAKTHARYGIKESYEGVYYGGANPLRDYATDRYEGKAAGWMTIRAPRIAFGGVLDGSADPGFYQTEQNEPTNANKLLTALGWEEPTGGTLILGTVMDVGFVLPENIDRITGDINLTAVPVELGETGSEPASSPYPKDLNGVSAIPAKTISDAGLDTVKVYSNTKMTIEERASLALNAGGTFQGIARCIENNGHISIPSGSVTILADDNVTSVAKINGSPNDRFQSIKEGIYMTQGSSIDVSGRTVDNSMAVGGASLLDSTNHLAGGTITLTDNTSGDNSVILAEGSALDVSGGYAVDTKGKVTGADAGGIAIQGRDLTLDADLKGYSLPNKKGGSISIHTNEIIVKNLAQDLPDASSPDVEPSGDVQDVKGSLALTCNRFDDTGFSRITLRSQKDLIVEESVNLAPSLVKTAYQEPATGGTTDQAHNYLVMQDDTGLIDGGSLMKVKPEYAGGSSISLSAGRLMATRSDTYDPKLDAVVMLGEGSHIETTPGGKVAIEGPNVEIAGSIDAPSGTVSVVSTGTDAVEGISGLRITETGRITAAGWNLQETKPYATGLPVAYTPMPAGQVSLESRGGSLIVEKGAVIDVSGSDPTELVTAGQDGTFNTVMESSDAGSVALTFVDTMEIEGSILGKASLAGLKGGTLSIARTNPNPGDEGGLTVSSLDLPMFQEQGFDAVTLKSGSSLILDEPGRLSFGRSLTLDAPIIQGPSGEGSPAFEMSAPYVKVKNSSWQVLASGNIGDDTMEIENEIREIADGILETGDGTLKLSADWVDIEGDVAFSRLKEVTFDAAHDIRLTDAQLKTSPTAETSAWTGRLVSLGDLSMRAQRIYPTTLSRFTIQSCGSLRILPAEGQAEGPILSAGGSLDIYQGRNIENSGVLAAPFGHIGLNASERIYLAGGSTVTVAGDVPIYYGQLSEEAWTAIDKKTESNVSVSSAPEKSVEITAGQEAIIRKGAELDLSGGGSIFSYSFEQGIDGSLNPLEKTGRYVIVPGISLPGDAVVIEGGSALSAGTYSILPVQYAFLPGAYVITDNGTNLKPWEMSVSTQGYPLVSGHFTVAGTGLASTVPRLYSVRPASDVLKEGSFTTKKIIAGDAGELSIKSPTAVVDGTIRALGLDGYGGGIIEVKAAEASIVSSSMALAEDFDVEDVVPEELKDNCVINAEGVGQAGAGEIVIGDREVTDDTITRKITIEDGGFLNAPTVILGARESITVEQGAAISATGAAGFVSLVSPEGKVSIEEGATVHAAKDITIHTASLKNKGAVSSEQGTLTLKSDRIVITDDAVNLLESKTAGNSGISVTESLKGFSGFESLSLKGSEISFAGDVDLSLSRDLSIDAPRLISNGDQGKGTIRLNAQSINLLNSAPAADSIDPGLNETAEVTFKADRMTVGRGDISLDGFKSMNIECSGDLTLAGKGSLRFDDTGNPAADASMNITAARVTTSSYEYDRDVLEGALQGEIPNEDKSRYEAPGFSIDAGNRMLSISSSGQTPGAERVPGGSLALVARSIDHAGTIDVSSCDISLKATGTSQGDGIVLKRGSRILDKGSDYGQGGNVELITSRGPVTISEGSLIDVSAGIQGDAGAVEISSANTRAELKGELHAHSAGGSGGSFSLDTATLDNFSAMNGLLSQGGFTRDLSIRTRSGNVNVAQGDKIKARSFTLTADKGNVDINGSIDASGGNGGKVEINSLGDLTLSSSGSINASNTGAGVVRLASASGSLSLKHGSLIDVSGRTTDEGGSLYLRALRTASGSDVRMDLDGTVAGASRVTAEAVKVYQDASITSSDVGTSGTYFRQNRDFMNSVSPARQRLMSSLELEGTSPDAFHLVPGIEIRSDGNMSVGTSWDLTQWKFGGEPGILSLRAAGDLAVTKDILSRSASNVTFSANLAKGPQLDSWGIDLIAGADLDSADSTAVVNGQGDLSVTNAVVYTESGPIRFASGRDTIIKNSGSLKAKGHMVNNYMVYNLATFDGTIEGETGRDLNLVNSNYETGIQSAAGDIDLTVGGTLTMGNNGFVRTTGWNPNMKSGWFDAQKYWLYQDGGDIDLKVSGDVSGDFGLKNSWDQVGEMDSSYYWSAKYGDNKEKNAFAGIGAMGGGDVKVDTGGDFSGQAGTFGQHETSDLAIHAGNDIDGRFLAYQGDLDLAAMGNVGTASFDDENKVERFQDQAVEAFDTRVNIVAQGDIRLGAVLNPGIAHPYLSQKLSKLTYNPVTTSARLMTVNGDITFTGNSRPYRTYYPGSSSDDRNMRILPPDMEVVAGGDISFLTNDQFILAPSTTGNLVLDAGGDISGHSVFAGGTGSVTQLYMSDLDPDGVYSGDGALNLKDYISSLSNNAVDYIHKNDTDPVSISAGRDVSNIFLYLPKKADIRAGNDITNFSIMGQNLTRKDISTIRAGGNIIPVVGIGDEKAAEVFGIRYGGPGTLLVQAGDSIDLGISSGISIEQNSVNSLPGCKLMVVAGLDRDVSPEEIPGFFADLKEAGIDYGTLLADDPEGAQKIIDDTRKTIIEPFLGQVDAANSVPKGTINMTKSQIVTLGADSGIYIVTADELNVGRSSLGASTQKQGTGISTDYGGPLNIFAVGDINVLESRVMTKFGGDILAWSDKGSINAGRGSKTTVSASPPQRVYDEVLKMYVTQPVAVAVGSGIRTLTYDPDGAEGVKQAPEAGDAYIFAPSGIIDAGEAGISAENLFLGAREVRNIQNIEFAGISVGVSLAPDTTGSLGAMTGTSGLTETSKLAEQAMGLGSSRTDKDAQKLADTYVPKWIKVMVIGFDDDGSGEAQQGEDENKDKDAKKGK